MALITCEDCGNQVSDHAEACPKCGWLTKPAPSRERMRPFGPGIFFEKTRHLHLLVSAAFASVGFLAMLDVEIITWGGGLLGAVYSTYLIAVLASRAYRLRTASEAARRMACFDALEVAVCALLISFIGGFWWGFTNQVLDGAHDVKAMYGLWGGLFGLLSGGALAYALTMAAVTLATEER